MIKNKKKGASAAAAAASAGTEAIQKEKKIEEDEIER